MDNDAKRRFDILTEDFEGGDVLAGDWGGTGTGGYMGMGGRVTSDDKLFNTFIKPFANVAKTAVAGAQALGTSAKNVIIVTGKAIMEKVFPFYKADYQKTFKAHDEAMRKIEKSHEAVYKDVMKAFKHPDFLVSAFFTDPGSFLGMTLHNPQTFVTLWGGARAPELFSNVLSSLSGGAVDPYLAKIKEKLTSNKLAKESFSRIVLEVDKKEFKNIAQALLSPDLLKAAINSDNAKKIQSQSMNASKAFLDKVLNSVQSAMRMTDIEQIQSVMGEKLPEIEQFAKIPKNERDKIEKGMLDGLKASVKQFYALELENQANAMVKAGVPKDNKLLRAYLETVKKIKAL